MPLKKEGKNLEDTQGLLKEHLHNVTKNIHTELPYITWNGVESGICSRLDVYNSSLWQRF